MFVPKYYYRKLFQMLQSWTQMFKSVEGYHKKIEIFMIRADIMEVTEAKMTRFLNGLNKQISNVVELQHYIELEDLLHMAAKIK